jgi:hypothetical protein
MWAPGENVHCWLTSAQTIGPILGAMTARPKVFCIGFQKTGTTSLYVALKQIGCRVSGTVADRWTAARLASEGAQLCIEIARRYDAAEDMPWPVFFRELDAAFPSAKFILTVRDKDAWYQSVDRHFGQADTEMHRFVYGGDSGRARDSRERWIGVYSAHNAAVVDYFRDRPNNLLVMDLVRGDGWEKLAPFLGVSAPDTPFPIRNTSVERAGVSYRLKRRLNKLAGRTPRPERLL